MYYTAGKDFAGHILLRLSLFDDLLFIENNNLVMSITPLSHKLNKQKVSQINQGYLKIYLMDVGEIV